MGQCRVIDMDEFRAGYVDAYYPNLSGYAYNAEMLSVSEGQEVMEQILKNVVRIVDCGGHAPILITKDGKELYSDSTDDFPQPTDEANDE